MIHPPSSSFSLCDHEPAESNPRDGTRSNSFSSETFVLGRRGHDDFFTAEIPEGRHVEGHVGEDHQVLKESEEGVDWRGGGGGGM